MQDDHSLETQADSQNASAGFKPVWFRSRRRLAVIFVIITLFLAVVLAAVYVLWKTDNKMVKDDQGQIISRADYVQPHGEGHVPEGAKNYTNEELIAENEQKIANGTANYETYLALAQLHARQGNTQKAIENYELASQKADPNMAGYKEFIAGNEAAIKTLKAN